MAGSPELTFQVGRRGPTYGLRPLGGRDPLRTCRSFPGPSRPQRGPSWTALGPGGFLGLGGASPLSPQTAVWCGHTRCWVPSLGSLLWPPCVQRSGCGGLLRVCPDADRDLGGGWPASLPGVLVLQPGAPGRFLALPVLPPNFTQERMKEFHWSGNGESEADLCLSLCLRLSLPLSLSGPLSLSAALSPGLWSLPWPQGPSQAASPLHQGPRMGRGWTGRGLGSGSCKV